MPFCELYLANKPPAPEKGRFLVLGTILFGRKVEYPAFFDGNPAHGRTVDEAQTVAVRLIDKAVAAQNVAVAQAVVFAPSPHLRLPQRIHADAR